MPLDVGDALILIRRERAAETERFFEGDARGFQVLGGDGLLGVGGEIADLLAGEAGVGGVGCGAEEQESNEGTEGHWDAAGTGLSPRAGGAVVPGAEVLVGDCERGAEGLGGAHGEVGIAEKFAGDEDEIGLAGVDDVFGLLGFGDHADGAGEDFGVAADLRGKRDLVAGAGGDFGVEGVTAGGGVDEVDAEGLDEAGELDGVVNRPAAFDPISSGDAEEEREMVRHFGADGFNDFAEETGAIVERAAVFVLAEIGNWREEFVDEIAVGAVDFDDLETGGEGAAGGGGEGVNQGFDFGGGEGVGDGVAIAEGDGAGGHHLPAVGLAGGDGKAAVPGEFAAGFAAGVGELDGGDGALGFKERDDAAEGFDVGVGPEAEVAEGDAAGGFDGGGFDHNEAGATGGAGAEVDEMPIVGEAIDGGVFTHGRDGDAVGEGDAADGEGGEQTARHIPIE